MNRRPSVTGGSIWYYWIIMFVPLGSKRSGIPLLNVSWYPSSVISWVFSQSVKFIKVVMFIKVVRVVNVEINVNISVRWNKMQHYGMIWQIVRNQLCLYKTTIGSAKYYKYHIFRHPHSITGLWTCSTYPLSCSKYATIHEEGGKVSLFLKTIEWWHSPKTFMGTHYVES